MPLRIGPAPRIILPLAGHGLFQLERVYGFDSRGLIEMKGKGQMLAYVLKPALLAA